MRTPSKKSQKLNNYLVENPNAKPSAVAKLFKVSVQSIYQRKNKLKSAAPKGEWKKLLLGTSDKSVSDLVLDVTRGRGRQRMADVVNSPSHYRVGGIETIDFIEAKNLGYNLGNVIKYVSRADHKGKRLEDLKKAQWYLNREVSNLEKNNG